MLVVYPFPHTKLKITRKLSVSMTVDIDLCIVMHSAVKFLN